MQESPAAGGRRGSLFPVCPLFLIRRGGKWPEDALVPFHPKHAIASPVVSLHRAAGFSFDLAHGAGMRLRWAPCNRNPSTGPGFGRGLLFATGINGTGRHHLPAVAAVGFMVGADIERRPTKCASSGRQVGCYVT